MINETETDEPLPWEDEQAIAQMITFAERDTSNDLGELFETFRQYLLDVARRKRRAQGLQRSGDSDFVQLTLIRGWERFSEFRGKTPAELGAWLRSILERVIIDHHRSVSAKKSDARREMAIEGLVIADKADSARARLLSTEQKETIRAAVNKLPAHYREIVTLRHFHELSFEEIALRTQKSADAVRKLWTRAICKLRDELQSSLDSGIR